MSERVIKFRGKKLDGGEWIYGSYLHQYYSIKNQGLIDAIAYTDRNQTFRPQVDPKTVGQFTGLRDNKRTEEYPEGQEVYESDLCEKDGKIYQVVWMSNCAKWGLKVIKTSTVLTRNMVFPLQQYICGGITGTNFEVIGNVYEHHHLLGEKI